MRKIKFRIWDQSKNGWADSEPYFNSCIGDFSVNDKKYIYQQFTGFHDQNTKEIYEGDIVKAMLHTENGVFDETVTVEIIPETTLSSHYGSDAFEEYTNIEVIGNIFENPELLK